VLGITGAITTAMIRRVSAKLYSTFASSAFLPESFGLVAFRFFPLWKTSASKIEIYDNNFLSLKKNAVRNCSAAAVLVASLFLFSTEIKMPFISHAGIGANLFEISDNNTQLTENTIVIDENAIQHSEIELDESTSKTSKKYHLIAGSFKYPATAEKEVKKFKSAGFSDAAIIDNGNGRVRISLFSCSNKSEVIIALEELKKQPQFSTVWILAQ
jgi:hypothetical protein